MIKIKFMINKLFALIYHASVMIVLSCESDEPLLQMF